jgi:uncharacterized protein (TIRG00374 family)
LLLLSSLPVLAILAIALVRRHASWRKLPLFAGLRIFERGRPILIALACILSAWLFDVLTIELVLYAVGLAPTLSAGLLVLLLTNLAIAVPVTPSNLGAHELGSTLALKSLGVDVEIAAAFALLYHGLHTIPVLLLGFVDSRRLLLETAKAPSSKPSG